MKVLHFTNMPLEPGQIIAGGGGMNGGGVWMAALLGRMLQATDLNIACASFGKVSKVEVSNNNRLQCYVLPERGELAGLKLCRDLAEEYQPDLLHIHGTENFYGCLTSQRYVDIPAVISLQGLMGPCSEWYRYFGNCSLIDFVRMHRILEIPVLRGQWMDMWKLRRGAKRERGIIQGNRFFIGRTAWDKAYIRALNPAANYFHGGELLREDFWRAKWDLKNAQRHRIIFTNAGLPRKGTETLLGAVNLLRNQFPDIQLCIAGRLSPRNGYGRYIRKRIQACGGCAVELGQLDASRMVTEMMRSHVFVSPSFIDNSPNAVCEAQLMGMPVISTYTGGVPSLIEEGRTGLFFPTGDAPMLAARLRELFENDELAAQLGKNSREAASVRHEPEAVTQQVLSAYEQILHRPIAEETVARVQV